MKQSVFRFLVLIGLILSFCSASVALAQNNAVKIPLALPPQSAADPNGAAVTDTITDISVAEFLHEMDDFAEVKSDVERKLTKLEETISKQSDPQKLTDDLAARVAVFSRKRKLSSWDFRVARKFQEDAASLFKKADKLTDGYADFLKQTDDLNTLLTNKKEDFRKFLKKINTDKSIEAQRNQLSDAIKVVDGMLLKVLKIRESASQAYRKQGPIIADIQDFRQDLKSELELFRKALFTKTAPAVYEPSFFSQLNAEAWQESKAVFVDLMSPTRSGFIPDAVTLAPVIFAFLMTLLILLRSRRNKSAQDFSAHPLVPSVLAAVVTSAVVWKDPPPSLIVVYWVILPILFFVFLKNHVESPKQRRRLGSLIALYVLLQVSDAVGLPLVFYRSLLFVASAAGVVWFLLRSGRKPSWQRKISGLVGLAIFCAELFGFHLLAALIARGTVKSAVLLVAVVILREKIVRVFSSWLQLFLERLDLLPLSRPVVTRRLLSLLQGLAFVLVGIALVAIWGEYDGYVSAFTDAWSWQLPFWATLTFGRVIAAVALFAITNSATFILCRVLDEDVYPARHIAVGTGKSINGLLGYLAWIIGLIVVVSLLGFDLQQFAIIAGALSVGVGFGLQNIINNFVSGLILLFERPVKVGDMLDIDGQWGTVEKVGLRSTIIRTGSRTQIIIPNSDMISHKVTNLTLSDPDYRIVIPICVAYGTDLDKARSVLARAALEVEGVSAAPLPVVYLTDFAESAINMMLRVWTHNVADRDRILSDVLFAIDRHFRAEGIVMPPPREMILKPAMPI